jgi:hypothetical protein
VDRDDLARTVLDYLAAAEARDLPGASAHLAPAAEIVFPGGVRHPDLAAVVAAARTRYRSIGKTIDTVDVDTAQGSVVVTGRLGGENLHGVTFTAVRFVDRFVLREGMIALQHVWNDLEESGVLAATSPAELPARHRPPC